MQPSPALETKHTAKKRKWIYESKKKEEVETSDFGLDMFLDTQRDEEEEEDENDNNLLGRVMRARNGAWAGTVMDFAVSVARITSLLSGCLMVVIGLPVLLSLAVMNSIGPWRRIAASGPGMDDGVMIAVGRIGAGRVHGWTRRDVARLAHSVQRVPLMNTVNKSFRLVRYCRLVSRRFHSPLPPKMAETHTLILVE